MAAITFRFLNEADLADLLPDVDTLLDLVAGGLRAHAEGTAVLPPKAHLFLPERIAGHFNILPGYVDGPGGAGVKVIGDFVRNHEHGLPSEIAMLLLYDPATGAPQGLLDATLTTWLRTAAVTAIGARALARPDARVLTHLGARGTAFQNLRLLAALFPLEEVRIVSKRPESAERLAARARDELGLRCHAHTDLPAAVRDADIIVEATRLERPEVLFPAEVVRPGALVVTYGWRMALDPALVLDGTKLVVDDWAQCCLGGQLHPLIEDGRLTRAGVHAEIGQIVAGQRPGRESAGERIVFWHRGFALSDIVLGRWLLEEATRRGVGTLLTLREAREE